MVQHAAQVTIEKASPVGATPVASEQTPLDKDNDADIHGTDSVNGNHGAEKNSGSVNSEKVTCSVTDDEVYTDIAVEVPVSVRSPCDANLQKASSGTGRASSKNSFSVLNDISDEDGKENIPPKRVRKPTNKVAENLNLGIAGLSKGGEIVSKPPQKKKK